MTQDDIDGRVVLRELWAGRDPYAIAHMFGGGRGRVEYLLNHLAATGLYDRVSRTITAQGQSVIAYEAVSTTLPPTTTTEEPAEDDG